ncbi:MAG: winged helix-turn-helix transcriptional regulator [Euryarchaeota archaeon]|jgi:ArsR family transcriptional regulator|nr:winged helix-turn-helix transcriptional regulator [Euryarchaeota archaeon]MBT3971969.1 winged helix-turn-helix transcriptional regulator [Euryarchaeota archaeon]MBT4406926.1 winged helix-turn-helix transcriptional regulator [Euryarchaeota archaeon]MBT6644656.1 winged helix-turn-helix transcriptional regulator [Euryarchaeota archaeon]
MMEATISESVKLDPVFLQKAAGIIKMLGHPDRLRIVELLQTGEHCVSSIQEYMGLSQPITSQHLKQMRQRGLVSRHREGNKMMYFVANPLIFKLLTCLRDTQVNMGCDALSLLD